MSDLINRNAAIMSLLMMYPFDKKVATRISMLMELPSAEPSIVLCKDCKYWDKDWQTIEGCHYCCMIDMQTEGEFFCAKGERREDGDENHD